MGFIRWIEETPLSVFVREDLYAYFWILILHALGMALLIGGAFAICLRVLGVAKGAPLEKFRGFFPVMWTGFALAVVSGFLLLAGYPAKALTNPVFGLKFISLAAAALLTRELARRLFPIAASGQPLPSWSRPAAGATLALWAGVVVAGKLLLYTHRTLMAS